MLIRILKRLWRWSMHALRTLILAIILLFGLQYSNPPMGEQWAAIAYLLGAYHFDYLTWELDALVVKTGETLFGSAPFMTEADRSAYVRAFMADLAAVTALEDQIEALYTDPDQPRFAEMVTPLQAERDRLRADLHARQGLAESILEGQVAAVLADEGFSQGGQIVPPVSAHFTQMPMLVVVSPRDTIRFDLAYSLEPIPVEIQAGLETTIDADQNVSTLIVPLGGMALYPSMIVESSSITYAADVIAHEWLHQYLFAFPLGLQYDFGGETRIINETTAAIFGQSIGPKVLARYYPELAPPPPTPTPETPPETQIPTEQSPTLEAPTPDPEPRFDFGAELNETRVTVDTMLANGEIEEAEAYMEERRQLFVENGYLIRKINQAYFAFYGGYQSPGSGAGGRDPIGPAVQAIRAASPSLHDWIVTMRGITTRDQLVAAAGE